VTPLPVDGYFSGGQAIRNRHAEVHRLAAGNYPVHRLEIEQIADDYLRTYVMQRLRAFVNVSHHRSTALPCFKSSSVTVRPTAPTRPAAPITRMGLAMFSSYALSLRAENASLEKTLRKTLAIVV
jgi:hypothetical protein